MPVHLIDAAKAPESETGGASHPPINEDQFVRQWLPISWAVIAALAADPSTNLAAAETVWNQRMS